jgi:hypothetical protein
MFDVEDVALFKWTITHTVSGQPTPFVFGHIEHEPDWGRKIPGRIAIDPCSGARTLIMRTDGSIPKRRGQLTMHMGPENNQTPDENLATILGLFANGGPYVLTMPTGRTMNFVFDLETDWREVRLTDRGYRITIGVAEV